MLDRRRSLNEILVRHGFDRRVKVGATSVRLEIEVKEC